jgi:predicted ferric reductase
MHGRGLPEWTPQVPGALAIAGATLILIMWWRGAPPAVGPGSTSTDAGRLTGLLAGYTALLQVLLRARVPVLERTLGTDRINAAHRLLGSYLLVAITAHATLITVGYSRSGGTPLLSQLGALVTSYSYVVWAVVAAGILLVVGLTSVPVIRRHLRYELWHALHVSAYVAVALAFLHQVALGEHFVHSPRTRMLWTALFAGVGATVLWYRCLRPLQLLARHRLKVAAVQLETPGAVSIWITGRRLDRFPAEAGQFFRWRFLTRGTWYVAHPYSLSAEPDGRRLRITATVSGRHSSRLPGLPPGTKVIAEGPSGGLIASPGWVGPVLLVAGGIGITPLRALLGAFPCGQATLVYRSRTASDIAFRAELERMGDERDARIHYLVGSRHESRNSLAPDHLVHLCPEIRTSKVYVCGSVAFVDHVRASLTALAVPGRHIHTEAFQL